MPYLRASYEQAATTPRSLCPPTSNGNPFSDGSLIHSTLTKKASRSKCAIYLCELTPKYTKIISFVAKPIFCSPKENLSKLLITFVMKIHLIRKETTVAPCAARVNNTQ